MEQIAIIHSHFLINSVSFEDGKKLHISEPELTQPSLEWLLVPVVLLGLLALWYGWAALWNGLTTLFP